MIKKIIKVLIPPDNWKIPVIIVLGIFCGLSIYVFYVSKAPSYLSDNPKTCINCHIMTPQYVTWNHSAHREGSHCNDCHVPHNNVVNKYYFKAKDGVRHAAVFTLRREPQVILIKEAGREVVQNNCIRCHKPVLADPYITGINREFYNFRSERKCWDCHRETPHGTVNSLSSVPNARVPLPGSPVPEWIKEIMKNVK